MPAIRSLNTIVLCASSLVALLSFWNRNDLPPVSAILPALAEEPRQEPMAKEPFTVEYSGVRYEVEPQFGYELNGMVVSYRQHDGSSRMHRAANDHLNVADLCVVWGNTATSPHLSEIEFWNGVFTCNFETSDSAAWNSIRPEQISNNHLISDDDAIRDRVADVRVGDQVRVRGWLATYGSGANRRGTSTRRDDAGNGACETIFVSEFDVVGPAPGHWRAALHASLAVLALALFVHFRLPHRPYAG
jgi:hypothetical protein